MLCRNKLVMDFGQSGVGGLLRAQVLPPPIAGVLGRGTWISLRGRIADADVAVFRFGAASIVVSRIKIPRIKRDRGERTFAQPAPSASRSMSECVDCKPATQMVLAPV